MLGLTCVVVCRVWSDINTCVRDKELAFANLGADGLSPEFKAHMSANFKGSAMLRGSTRSLGY